MAVIRIPTDDPHHPILIDLKKNDDTGVYHLWMNVQEPPVAFLDPQKARHFLSEVAALVTQGLGLYDADHNPPDPPFPPA